MAASSYGRRSHIGLGQAPDIQCLPTGRRLHIKGYIPFEKRNMRIFLSVLIIITLNTTGLSINPMKEYTMKPEAFEINYEEHKIKTNDGAELNLWLMESNPEMNNGITIVIVGSDAGNMGFSLPYAFHLINLGYQVVTFDYRGFGGSSDFNYNPKNVYHSEYITDFNTVMEWSESELQYDKIGTLSFSMGTLISAVGYSTSSYDFYVGEGFIISPIVNKNRIEELKEKEMHLPKNATEDSNKIDDLNIPALLIAGRMDKVTTINDSQEFCKKHELAKTIEHDGEHLKGAVSLGFQNYINMINEFIINTDDNKR